jgi:hypothetical protein
LYFICLNADLERQFEFVQQTWVDNPVFAGLFFETDPLIGHRGDEDTFTVPTSLLLAGSRPPFVRSAAVGISSCRVCKRSSRWELTDPLLLEVVSKSRPHSQGLETWGWLAN